MDLRAELGQLSWFARQYRHPSRWKKQVQVIRHMEPLHIRRRRRHSGEVWGVSIVRDEVDVVGLTVRHLLDQGVSRILVADNCSVDGTRELLRSLARTTRRVAVVTDHEPAYYQSEKMTWLAHQAWRGGADWIVPFDADEFWFAEGMSIAEYLGTLDAGTGIVHAEFCHMVPTAPAPDDLAAAEFIMDTHPAFPGKVAVRAHPLLEIITGNHGASRVGANAKGLHIAHAQYRSPVQIARKVRQGNAAASRTGEDLSWFSPHWASGSRLGDEEIQEVWENISHGRPDERIRFEATGPMVRLHPLTWRTWDPDGVVARAQRAADA
jgi:hypothetical protein